MNRHLLTVVLLILALVFYSLGLANVALGAVIIGCALVMWFWVRAPRKPSLKVEQF
jgi:hypothetical protein